MRNRSDDMATQLEVPPGTAGTSNATTTTAPPEERHRSIFEVPQNFFDSCNLLPSPHSLALSTSETSNNSTLETLDESEPEAEAKEKRFQNLATRWTCNTCRGEFESLKDQRSHFKSDIHRFNVKLSIAGKNIVKEEDFDELTSESFKDYDVSSISGSEDEVEKEIYDRKGSAASVKQKLFVRLQTGERISVWKCLIMEQSENIVFENDKAGWIGEHGSVPEKEVIGRLTSLINEPRDNTHLRIVLLASGGHFAGCVFDGNIVVAHKTFHRYVVRAKAGKKQSSKDASGKAANSAGASLRRHNELALKKELQELLAAWTPYFDASSCVFIYAPSNNRQLLFNGEKPYFSCRHSVVQNIPLAVRRPTLKEARRLYSQLTQVVHEVNEKEILPSSENNKLFSEGTLSSDSLNMDKKDISDSRESTEVCPSCRSPDEASASSEAEREVVCTTTPLHEATKSGNVDKVLELLEQGLDPCIKDERGRTPYMLASEKEVRNTFRRFMASNPDRWDWHAAKVPSALTKEMEESQAAKQAEKDTKRKARAKELKKLRKAREKKAQAQVSGSQNASKIVKDGGASPSVLKNQPQPSYISGISKEEDLKRAMAAEREKRAAAAERRIAASANAQSNSTTNTTGSSQAKGGLAGDINCSCCNASLAGKVPFHRYNYKYCSTSCMHVHREALEDG
ncbi:uncharacterized protein LOC107423709 [Ziziphus jujuba]|uniref:Uncharacterized protein LOC107423709 n=1 Tax=Ziziphus jujuba TaxID=326968 RepID=A0ABM3IU28_ZIZJJ|nr:uncharacterized protein LOC107423709 [Ziziphus jujuba]